MPSSATKMNARVRLQPGTRIGNQLRVGEVLGQGGTAIVYEAEHLRLRATVALKVAHVTAREGDGASRLVREGQVCASLVDPRIPRVFDVGELDDGRPYLVMEKIEGHTLEEHLKQGPLDAEEALSIVREVLSALDTVHRAGFVHRDVKPSNLILRDDEEGRRVFLMDFGVSKPVGKRSREIDITRPGTVVGTPLYMAPEQLVNGALDIAIDTYAVGVMLYEMLTGRAPFAGHSSAEVMVAVLRRNHASLRSAASHLPASVVELVERAMAERAEDRFASARIMRDALDDALGELRHAQSPRTTYVPGPPRQRSRAPFAYASLILCALTGGVYFVTHEPAPLPVALPEPVAAAPVVAQEAPAPLPAALSPETAPHPLKTRRRGKKAERLHVAPARNAEASDLVNRSVRELDALRGVLSAPTP